MPTEEELEDYLGQANGLEPQQNSEVVPRGLDRLLGEREKHRGWLFIFAIGMSIAAFVFLVGIVVFQGIVRLYNPSYEILSDTGIQTVAVATFVEIFGLVCLIAKSLWDNKEMDILKGGK